MPISAPAWTPPPPPPPPPPAKPVASCPEWWADLTLTMHKTVTTRLRVKGYDTSLLPL